MENNDQITFKCSISSTDSSTPLGMRVLLDNVIIYDNSQVSNEEHIEHKMSDADGEHELAFEMFGKLPAHTKINEAGEILSDVLLIINNINIDEIDISQIFQELAVYHHDFNGTKPPVEDPFCGSMGCNGVVKLKFSTPLYLWLLENM